MKSPPVPPLRSTRLLDQLRERVRFCHYTPATERSSASTHRGVRGAASPLDAFPCPATDTASPQALPLQWRKATVI